MGNRSSSHYPPPAPWLHQRTSYSTSASPYPEAKRPIAPGAFAEPYIVNHPSKSNHRRSMCSLNADSGFIPSPSDSERGPRNFRGSRMSLNQLDFDHIPPMMAPPHHRLIIPPDSKTLKKLEKMEKKHQKLMKKLGARGVAMGMPPPMHSHLGPPPPPRLHPMYSRAMSFDELSRLHESEISSVPMRNREWKEERRMMMPTAMRRETTQSQYLKQQHSNNFSSNTTTRRQELGGSLASSSSPMTSSEEGGNSSADPWNNSSSISSGRNLPSHRDDVISPPMYSSTPHQKSTSPHSQPVTKTIEVKMERSEKIEIPSEKQSNVQNSQNVTYAQPIIRGQPTYGSRSSSIATSQMRCDQSEIDFSWVNEEEDKLKREKRKSDVQPTRLPEFYFGMDPPLVEEKENGIRDEMDGDDPEERSRRRRSVLDKTAQFEMEARRVDRKEPSFISRSSHHLSSTNEIPHPDYSPLQVHTKESGPSERRIYRVQRQSDNNQRADDRRYRSSIAF